MTITAENHAARATRIGSSDAPTVMGCNPYKQQVDLWMEKTGQKESPDLSANLAIRMGDRLENIIAEEWAASQGVEVYEDTTSYVCKDWQRAVSHIDMRIKDSNWIVEVKNRSHRQARYYGESGSEDAGDVMPYDYCQIQHHCLCGGWDGAYLVCYLGGGDLRHFKIAADWDFIQQKLLPAEQKFWACVEAGERPELDLRHRTTPDLLKQMYPEVDGEIKPLGNHGQALHQEYVEQRAIEKDASARAKELKLAITDLMGEAYVGLLPDGGAYRRKVVERKAYSVEGRSYIDMRYAKRAPI